YGMGMQMLIYLFVLSRHGEKRYGMEVVPAGVLYTPARDVLIAADRGDDPEKIRAKREKKLLRSGLILDDPDVVDAMEKGSHKYLPVKVTKTGGYAGDCLASAERLGKLSNHVDAVLLEMGREITSGVVDADPYYRGPDENACLYCDYCEACRFGEKSGDKKRYLTKLKPGEAWEKIEEECADG
ncbi:MAG: PD-(D/E)XK nuclease family protein, partial [Oscillospiraceae bacterium]|nr:PD-(D/E)XK nuclease family protein [Oscillospiraceae bacterium]